MRLIVFVCVLGLLVFVLGQAPKKHSILKERKEPEEPEDTKEPSEPKEPEFPQGALKYWTHSWPKCIDTYEFAWRPCYECCPLGYYCTTNITWVSPYGQDGYLVPPVFMWKKWCCENEPCPNLLYRYVYQ